MRRKPFDAELAQRIIAACAEACGLSVTEMLGRDKWIDAAIAKTAAVTLLHNRGLSYREISLLLGGGPAGMYAYLKKSPRMSGVLDLVLARVYAILTRDRHKFCAFEQQPKCSERACPMPASIDGYCRQHWAMRETPKLFETYVAKPMGGYRASSAGRRPLIKSIH